MAEAQLGRGKGMDASEDVELLRSMGYAQELMRRMSGFSNFAISFSIICILAGGITSLQLGVSAVGGAAAGIVWPLGVGFSLLVALCMAQVASAFPTAGGLYNWSSIGVQPPNDKALTVLVAVSVLLGASWWLGVQRVFRGPPVMSIASVPPPAPVAVQHVV